MKFFFNSSFSGKAGYKGTNYHYCHCSTTLLIERAKL
jgi:hypothetical protein